MKRILLFLSLILGFCSQTIQSNCIGCKDLQRELVNERKHAKELSAELRALSKDLLSVTKEHLKLMGAR